MKCDRFLSIPVFLVFILLGISYYATVFVFIDSWVGLRSAAGLLNASIFSLLTCLCGFSFLTCVLTDPGRVPSSYVPDVEHSQASDRDPRKNVTQSTSCDKCRTYKPPRAHHCRVCRCCILRMDHHCKWINNCVGYWNYKAYVILVLYATLGSIYSTVMIANCGFAKDWDFGQRATLKIFFIASGALMIGLSLIFGTLLGWHIFLIGRNMTTIEYHQGVRMAWLARKSGKSYRHPYDVGVFKNISLVLGPNMLKWLCPTSVSHMKDGISFPTSRDTS